MTPTSGGSGQLGYRKFIEWLRGRCYPTMEEARAAFYAEAHPDG